MAPTTNGRYLFKEVPTGYPVPGKTTIYDDSQIIDPETVPLDGGFLIKTLVVSIDPYMRGRMRSAETESYSTPFAIGEPLANHGVGVVLRSENAAVKPGDHLHGFFPFQQYIVHSDPKLFRLLENKENLPWSTYIGILGMPGETAYYAWKEYANPNKGDVAFVTTGAGPVGATVIQLAKADGLKVIASAGSDEKVEYMKSLGTDVAFNYKTTNTAEVLQKDGPIDIYWDNVGGETLEAAIHFANRGARFLECGMISAYNTTTPYLVKNIFQIVPKSLHIHGFLVSDLRPKYEQEFHATFPARVASGEIRFKEYFVRGLENAGEGISDVMSGNNFGKCVIVVADE